jgi:hypothetical protein
MMPKIVANSAGRAISSPGTPIGIAKGMATLIATYNAANIAVRAICLLVIFFIVTQCSRVLIFIVMYFFT